MKLSLVSTLTPDFVPGFKVLLRSLLTYNPITFDYIVFEVFPLTADDKADLLSIYPYLKFRSIQTADYNYNSIDTKWRVWGYNIFNRFDMFLLSEYDRIIFLDVDLVVRKSLQELFDTDVCFAACEMTKGTSIDHRVPRPFDGGVMVISQKFLTPQVRSDLISLSKLQDWSSDEPVLNQYFEKEVTYLDKQFNTLTTELTIPVFKRSAIIHFVGHCKPWHAKKFDPFVLQKANSLCLNLALSEFLRYS